MLDYALKKLGAGYEIFTAQGSIEALGLIEKQSFDLIVTDYMMKVMTGVDLARAARRISPHTQIILMSAYGSKRLQATSESLGFEGYLDKPFEMSKIREIIRNAFEPSTLQLDQPSTDGNQPLTADILKHLRGLQQGVSALCVLLLSSDGHPVQVVGQTDGLRISNISALIAANFMGTTELANLLGNRSVFRSSFHVGDDYNLYVYDVNDSFLLAVVFDAKRKSGVVWFYTKQAANALLLLLEEPSAPTIGEHPFLG